MNSALVIDDHPVTHLGCNRLLRDAGFESVYEASTCEEGYRASSKHQPEFIVLDLGLPGVGGLAMIERLLDKTPGVKILVFSMHDDPIFAARTLEAGAHGYLTKNSKPDDFTNAIRTIRAGRVYLEHEMATQLAMMNAGHGRNPISHLTPRELQVLQLVGKGRSHSEIAEQLNISYKTVANTCTQLKNKLGVKKLPDLIRIAIENSRTTI